MIWKHTDPIEMVQHPVILAPLTMILACLLSVKDSKAHLFHPVCYEIWQKETVSLNKNFKSIRS